MSYSGKYKPKVPEKYLGNPDDVVFRSLWELKFMKYCDAQPSILKWSSETVVVPYISPVDSRRHRYFVDFFIRVKQRDGTIKDSLIEIKPFCQTNSPKIKDNPTNKQKRRYLKENKTYMVNAAKWHAANIYCKEHGWDFKILTEKNLFPKKPNK